MRESRTYGFVRGARGNSRPYRDRRDFIRRQLSLALFTDAKLDLRRAG